MGTLPITFAQIKILRLFILPPQLTKLRDYKSLRLAQIGYFILVKFKNYFLAWSAASSPLSPGTLGSLVFAAGSQPLALVFLIQLPPIFLLLLL
jgi:hypothetical protein